MNKADIIRLSIFSALLCVALIFYYNLGFLSFSNVNINEQLPKANKISKQTIDNREPNWYIHIHVYEYVINNNNQW